MTVTARHREALGFPSAAMAWEAANAYIGRAPAGVTCDLGYKGGVGFVVEVWGELSVRPRWLGRHARKGI